MTDESTSTSTSTCVVCRQSTLPSSVCQSASYCTLKIDYRIVSYLRPMSWHSDRPGGRQCSLLCVSSRHDWQCSCSCSCWSSVHGLPVCLWTAWTWSWTWTWTWTCWSIDSLHDDCRTASVRCLTVHCLAVLFAYSTSVLCLDARDWWVTSRWRHWSDVCLTRVVWSCSGVTLLWFVMYVSVCPSVRPTSVRVCNVKCRLFCRVFSPQCDA